MARGDKRETSSTPALVRFVDELTAIPRTLVLGWFAGVLVPVAAVAGIVASIYFLTQKVPFFSAIEEDDDGRRIIVRLVEPEEAGSLLRKGGEAARAFGDEIRSELEGPLEE
jgi:hypothetical protein